MEVFMNVPHIAPLVLRIILRAAKLLAHIPEDFSTNAHHCDDTERWWETKSLLVARI